jgi:hypothetical protein
VFNDRQKHLAAALWPVDTASISPSHQQLQYIDWANPNLYTSQDIPVCQMFCFYVLPPPLILPYGPICCASAGFAVFKAATQSLVGPSFDLSWLDHPLILDFTNACKKLS